MAYNSYIADRVIAVFDALHPYSSKKMFGGMGIMVNGNMCIGVMKDSIVVRVGKDEYQHTLTLNGAAPFDFTGKPLTGWVYVDEAAIEDEQSLFNWINKGLDFVLTLPAK